MRFLRAGLQIGAPLVGLALLLVGMWPPIEIQGQLAVPGSPQGYGSTPSGLVVPLRFKGEPTWLFGGSTGAPQATAALSDAAVDCQGFNAAHIDCFVSGSSNPSATLQFKGGPAAGADASFFQNIPDPAGLVVGLSANKSFDLTIGSAFLKAQLTSISGTFGVGQGFTVLVTPFVAPGPTGPKSPGFNSFYGQPYIHPAGLPLSFELLEYGAGGVGPHASTQRATFTLPASNIGYCELLKVLTWRDGAPSPAGQAAAWATLQAASGGGAQFVAIAQTPPSQAGLDITQTDQSVLGWLNPGDIITFNTIDQSTGGTNSFYMTAKIFLFGLPS